MRKFAPRNSLPPAPVDLEGCDDTNELTMWRYFKARGMGFLDFRFQYSQLICEWRDLGNPPTDESTWVQGIINPNRDYTPGHWNNPTKPKRKKK